MSTATAVTAQSPTGSMFRAYRTEAKYEFLKTLRQPAYVIPTLTFPLIFYVMFGIVFGGKQAVGEVNMATYLLATYSAFGVIGASLFGFAVGVAMERGYGWLQVKRASPMPPLAYLAAKAVMAMVFSAILVVSLFVVGVAFGGVHLSIGRFLGLAGTVIVGTIPFCALGLVIGCYSAPNTAPAVVNILFLPLSFLFRLVASNTTVAKVSAACGAVSAAVSSGTAGLAAGWICRRRTHSAARGSFGGFYRGISFACTARFQAR